MSARWQPALPRRVQPALPGIFASKGPTRKLSGLITVSFKLIDSNRQSGSDRGF
jgi:hypothetical protein